MAERVFTNRHQIIEIIYDGDHDVGDSNRVVEQLIGEVAKLKSRGQPVKLLMDLTNLGKTDRRARQNVIKMARTLDFQRVGVFGANTFNQILAKFIILVSGKTARIKIFPSRNLALGWLNGK